MTTKLLCAVSEGVQLPEQSMVHMGLKGTWDKIGTCPFSVTQIGLSGIGVSCKEQERRGAFRVAQKRINLAGWHKTVC